MLDLDPKAWRTAFTHPAFRDIYFYILKKSYIEKKGVWKIRVRWMHVQGYEIAEQTIKITREKMKEFIKYDASEQKRRALSGNGRTLEIPPWRPDQGPIYDTLRVEHYDSTGV